MAKASLEGLTLHVADVARSLECYLRIPGARLEVYRPGDYALVQIGGGRLGLLQRRLSTPFHIEIATADLEGTYDELRSAGVSPETPPRDRPWGDRDFRLVDPDGNIIEFASLNHAHEPLAEELAPAELARK